MGITTEKAWELLKARGINTEEELQKELKNNPIEIGMFTMPYPKDIEQEA